MRAIGVGVRRLVVPVAMSMVWLVPVGVGAASGSPAPTTASRLPLMGSGPSAGTSVAGPADGVGSRVGGGPTGTTGPVEDVSARGQFVRVMDSGGGQSTATFGVDALNFQDAQGRWQPIDNTLTLDDQGVAHNRANRYRVDLPADASGSFRFETVAGRGVTWTMVGLSPAAGVGPPVGGGSVVGGGSAPRSVQGSTATYAIGADRSVRVEVGGNALSADVLLTDAQANPSAAYLLSFSRDLHPVVGADGAVSFGDPAYPGLEMAAPVVVDGAGRRAPLSAVTVTVTPDTVAN